MRLMVISMARVVRAVSVELYEGLLSSVTGDDVLLGGGGGRAGWGCRDRAGARL